MDSGLLIIFFIFFFAFLTFLVGAYCHFCGETGSGGRYYGSNENIAAAVVFTKAATADPTKNKCKCGRKFKGRCNSCEGETFVDDGELGSPTDFGNFGGDRGFDFPGGAGGGGGGGGGNPGDPLRGFLGNGSAQAPPAQSALDQPDYSSYGAS